MRSTPRRRLRKRRTVVLLLAALVLTAPLWARGPAERPPARPGFALTVHQGDTLWDLALRYGPEGQDTRRLVCEMSRVNRLEGGLIHPGDRLVVPGRWRG